MIPPRIKKGSLNPKLNVGDKIVLFYMKGETSIPPGTKGVVTRVEDNVYGDTQYGVKWKWTEGDQEKTSSLSLISSEDAWVLDENPKQDEIKEMVIKKKTLLKESDEIHRMNRMISNIESFKHFNVKFLVKYLLMIRESGIVNMLGAAPYLYMGRDRIAHEFKYNPPPNEESFEEVLDNANQAQAEMINGVINYLNSQGKEESLENINRYLPRFASMILENYILTI